MRIPLTRADWPAAFNDISKFIGRQWPAGKLKLGPARETTAFLFGYHSVHDAKRELTDELLPASYSISAFSNSMALKALVKYHIDPRTTLTLFNSLPWRILSCWEMTQEAEMERYQQERKQKGHFPLIFDEFGLIANYKSPQLLTDMVDSLALPGYEYAVNHDGLIYSRQHLEYLLSDLSITNEELNELSFAGTAEDFVREFIVPLVWQPISDQVLTTNYRGENEWHPPYMLRIEGSAAKGFKLFHEGYQAYYPVSYPTEAALKNALIQLYAGKPLAAERSSDCMVIEGQSFVSAGRIKPYNQLTDSTWLAQQAWPSSQDLVEVNPVALPKVIHDDHYRIARWLRPAQDRALKQLACVTSSDLGRIIQPYFSGTRLTLRDLQAQGEFMVESYEDDTPEERAEHESELASLLDEHKDNGARIFALFEELTPYYDEVAISHLFQAYVGNYRDYVWGCNARDMGFLAYLLGQRLKQTSGQSCDNAITLAAVILRDLATDMLSPSAVMRAWQDGCSLIRQHSAQNEAISAMCEWSFHCVIRDSRYLTHGAEAKLTRKSSADAMGDLMRLWRKHNATPVMIQQERPQEEE